MIQTRILNVVSALPEGGHPFSDSLSSRADDDTDLALNWRRMRLRHDQQMPEWTNTSEVSP